ncbi:MAG: putative two-component sensor histidine kinase [Symbiobacteriaceae bacterium]|jgi:HAMP domain-containing protein|nr:putative two-component sensor histidine kinase [Symbiobacteriaceae bacterium]
MRWHPKRWSLATKWSLMLTALALGPLLAVISFSYQAASAKLVGQAVAGLHQNAATGAANLDDAVAERVQQARFLADLWSVRSLAAAPPLNRASFLPNVNLDLRGLQKVYPDLQALDLLDGQGKVIYSTAGNQGVMNDPAMLKAAAAGQLYMGGLQPATGLPGQVLVIAVPATAGAVLRTETSAQFLMERVGTPQSGYSLLVDQEGRVIASGTAAGPAGEAPAVAAPRVGDTLQVDATGRITSPGGDSLFAQSTALGALPWRYVVAISEGDLARELNAQKGQALLLALGVSAIIGALARLLARGFTRPLSGLAEATRALAAGDLTHEVKPSPRLDEVGQLQNAFAEAYGQLRRLAARMRLSSILVAEAATHMHTMATDRDTTLQPIATASQKLSVVAQDLDRQVSHFKV